MTDLQAFYNTIVYSIVAWIISNIIALLLHKYLIVFVYLCLFLVIYIQVALCTASYLKMNWILQLFLVFASSNGALNIQMMLLEMALTASKTWTNIDKRHTKHTLCISEVILSPPRVRICSCPFFFLFLNCLPKMDENNYNTLI